MNTRSPLQAAATIAALSVSFNDDSSLFAVGLDTGFSKTCRPQHLADFNGGIGCVQLLGSSNLVALVGGGTNPKYSLTKVVLWDIKLEKEVAEIGGLNSIVRSVRFNRSYIVVVMQNQTRIYTFGKQPKFLTSYDTDKNLLGLCCLTDKALVIPARTAGHLQVIQLASSQMSIITAHKTALEAVAVSRDGNFIATASEVGTLVHVFSIAHGAPVATFRRGADYATIFSLAFSPSGKILACTSDKSTLHLFDVGRHADPTVDASSMSISSALPSPKWGVLSRVSWLPRIFRDEYSFLSVEFTGANEPNPAPDNDAVLGTSQPAKGVLAWIDEDNIVVVGAGRDARWEKFSITRSGNEVALAGQTWKRYLEHI